MKKGFKLTGLIIVIFLSVLFICICEFEKENYTFHSDYLKELKKGDLILRQGTGVDSFVIMKLSGSDYSHIGIVTSITPEILITHATSDDDLSHKNMVITSRAEDFLSKELSKKFAVIRYSFFKEKEDAIDRIVTEVLSHKGESFELGARDSNEEKRYCTTLIYDAIKKEKEDFELEFTGVDIPLMNGFYLFPKAFIEYDRNSLIHEE